MELSLLTFSMIPDAAAGNLDAETLCRAAAENGVFSLDMMEHELELYGEEKLLNAMKAAGVRCGCVIAGLPFFRNPESFEGKLDEAVAAARRMGAETLMVVPGGQDEAECAAFTREELFRRAAECYTLAVERAGAAGIRVGFENTPQRWKPLCAPADCRALLEQVPGLGFILDTGNFRVADPGCDELSVLEAFRDRLIRVHLKDVALGDFDSGEQCADGRYIRAVTTGAGVIPVREIIGRLIGMGYRGAWAVEYAAGAEVHGEEHGRYLRTYVRNIRAWGEGRTFCPPRGRVPGIGLPVSRLVFGTAIPPMLAGKDVFSLLDAALASGINTFDSARGYGGAEACLGRWIRERNNRDRVVLLSKCGNYDAENGVLRVNRQVILRECAESLEALGVDCIDIYLLHRDDPRTPVSEFIETLNELKAAGKIRTFGVSNWTVERIREANGYAAARGLSGFEVSSPNYGLARQKEDPWGGGCVTAAGPEHAADRVWYAETGMPVFAYSGLGRGFFSGRFRAFDEEGAGKVLDPPSRKGYLCPENMRRLRNAEEMAARKGCGVSQIALRYLFSSPMNVFGVLSIGGPHRLEENITASLLSLSAEEAETLERDEA